MRCLILAAGRFDETLKAEIASGRAPRLDVFLLADKLPADLIDFSDVDRSRDQSVRFVAKTAGYSAAVALLGFKARARYDAILTTGEDIGLPLAAMQKLSRARFSHTMIAHTLFPAKKRVFFSAGRVGNVIDRMLVYSTSEEQHASQVLHFPERKIQRIAYHADQEFFRPDGSTPEPASLCAAGQLLRDYECLVAAVRDLPVKLQIAAGSPWIEQRLEPNAPLPPNVTWGKLNRYELRALYARSALAVVPIKQNPYQTGIATILEMMAMGKCVIATRTIGQTDTIVDGVTGVYVPPGDPGALRAAISRLLANPDEAHRIGRAARAFIEENAGIDLFVTRVADATRSAHAARSTS